MQGSSVGTQLWDDLRRRGSESDWNTSWNPIHQLQQVNKHLGQNSNLNPTPPWAPDSAQPETPRLTSSTAQHYLDGPVLFLI